MNYLCMYEKTILFLLKVNKINFNDINIGIFVFTFKKIEKIEN